MTIKAEDSETSDDSTPADEENSNPRLSSGSASEQPRQASITIDDANVVACYANFCRVSSTPEEMILDLGLNPNPYGVGETTIKVSQRIILNHFTAKRLLGALSKALQRHEQAFGVLETDVRKRVREK